MEKRRAHAPAWFGNLALSIACAALIGGPIYFAIAALDRDAQELELEWAARPAFIPAIPPMPATIAASIVSHRWRWPPAKSR